jgi:peptidoglycan hydrolase-like protein with peptidoglycan-binding domain
VEERTRPDPVFIFPRHPTDYSLGRGDENIYVGVVQLLLREIVTLYGEDADLLPLDGVFGESTERAVKDFQRIQRLPEDGRVDRITWNRLARAQMPRALDYFRE